MTARAAALISVPGAFALGAGAAHLVAARHPERFSLDFAQPLVVANGWGPYGTVCTAILVATVGFATLGLFAFLRGTEPGPARPAVTIAVAAAAALAAAYAWPFVFSSDVYAYAAYGAIASHGGDPYVRAAPALSDPAVAAARLQWGGSFPACVYGPAFVALVRFVVTAFGETNLAALLSLLRLLSCGAFVASIFALDAALQGVARRRRFVTLAAFGLNPVAIWSSAEGHNDALLLLAALLGFGLVRHGRPLAGAFFIGLTPLVKATGAALACAFALDTYAFAARGAGRSVAALAAGLGVAGAFALPPFRPALEALLATAPAGRGTPGPNLLPAAPVLAAACAAAVYGVRRLLVRERDGHAWLGIAVWLAVPVPYPWYVLWFLPAVAAAGEGPVAYALYGATISSVVRYLPDAFGHIDASGWLAIGAVAALPLLLAAPALGRSFNRRKTTSS